MAKEYPENDHEFQEFKLEKVSGDQTTGFKLSFDGGLCCWSGDHNPIVPMPGMTLRQYGKGFGYRFRGIFIDGHKFFYRTPEEDAEKAEIDLYGADAADWLARWDAGRGVWSIEMGGLGPGYEQCIHITAAEILRHLLAAKYDAALWQDKDTWARDRELIEKDGFANPVIEKLGLSGAQWGAAMQVATKLYMDGPRKIMNLSELKDRHIQVSKNFPQAA